MPRGYVYIFTGDGKGKTTTGLGMAVRAIGAGINVFVGQFIKNENYSEIKAFKTFEGLITIEQFGTGKFIDGKPTQEEISSAHKGLERIKFIVKENRHKMVILDEANLSVELGLFPVEDIIEIIKAKPYDMELIITGRRMPQDLIEYADTITEMVSIKHYFQKGIMARFGIEK